VVGQDRETTIIDGDSSGSVVTFDSSEDSTALLSGFTIQNGLSENGGGIRCNGTSPTLDNLIIRGNHSSNNGGGIFCSAGANATLKNVLLDDNSARSGSGIYLTNSSPELENVSISNNSSNDDGGGLHCVSNSSPSLKNVNIINNSAGTHGGGIRCQDNSSPSLENVLIANNTALQKGGGLHCRENSNPSLVNVTITNNSAGDVCGGIYIRDNSNPILMNTLLWNNTLQQIYFISDNNPSTITISYSDIQDGQDSIVTNDNGTVIWGDGNIDVDPVFVDTANGNYHLLASSQCINGGDPTTFDSDGSRADMGAYPYLNSYSGPTWYVAESGNDTTATGASDDPFRSIQAGINFSSDADSVTVAAGTYVENINFRDRNIKVVGADRETTIIDGNQNGSVIQIVDSDSAYIAGFTIQNGTGTSDEIYEPWVGGGGIFTKDANVNIDNCRITNCSENYRYGGGILFYPSSKSLRLTNSVIDNCSSSDAGGGLALFESGNFTFTNSRIEACYAGFAGGAMYSSGELHTENVRFINNHANSLGGAFNSDGGNSYFEHCLFSENLSGNGGGAINFGSTSNVVLNQCTLSDNDGTTRGGAIIKSGPEGTLTLFNSILQNNSDQYLSQIWLDEEVSLDAISIEYSNIQGDTIAVYHDGGEEYNLSVTNIDIPSRFISVPDLNYGLLATSFLINAGHPDSTDSDGTIADMGAYPYLNSYSGPTWYITEGGNDTTATGSSTDPFRSIQAGMWLRAPTWRISTSGAEISRWRAKTGRRRLLMGTRMGVWSRLIMMKQV